MIGKLLSNVLETDLDLPLIFTLSVISDVDLLIPFIEHRGPTHSVLAIILIFLPLLTLYRKRAIPYLLATIQHPILGDFFSGGKIQLFWPLTTGYYGIEVGIKNPINIIAELTSFTIAILVMFRSRDHTKLLSSKNSLILAIPLFTLISPTFLKFPLEVPILLIPPHLILIILLAASVITGLKRKFLHTNMPNCS